MKDFNILDRSLTIHQHYLLEASAGTGKTFSIQHLVVRLLIEKDNKQHPYSITNLLVVTFTRAATRDLRFRIHHNIKQSLYSLRKWLIENVIDLSIPDYLLACIEKGIEHVKEACKYLEDALFTFDQAPIFTIHAFCARMLRQYAIETNIGLHVLASEQALPQSEIIEIVRNFFRTEIRMDQYSPAQLAILLKEDPHQYKLLQTIQSGHQFPIFPSFQDAYIEFVQRMTTLKQQMSLRAEKMVEDFQLQATAYRSYKGYPFCTFI
jgi:exodeoxyribonuclease V beta subunit